MTPPPKFTGPFKGSDSYNAFFLNFLPNSLGTEGAWKTKGAPDGTSAQSQWEGEDLGQKNRPKQSNINTSKGAMASCVLG